MAVRQLNDRLAMIRKSFMVNFRQLPLKCCDYFIQVFNSILQSTIFIKIRIIRLYIDKMIISQCYQPFLLCLPFLSLEKLLVAIILYT